MKNNIKLLLGVVLSAVILSSFAVAVVYAAPITNQDRTQQTRSDQILERNRMRIRDQTCNQNCTQNNTASGNYSECPNFVDENGDGICDNCPGEQGTGLGDQQRHGWG